jgi:hypothetical protein
MDLHGLARSLISVVNPFVPVTVQVSTGNTVNADGSRTPVYATPGLFVGGIAGNLLTVSAQSNGQIQKGQGLTDEIGLIAPGTVVTEMGTGTGGLGTYEVNITQNVTPEVMQAAFSLSAQIQALAFRDIVQIEGLNLQGTRRAIYLSGEIDGLVRADNKGGDLITFSNGGVWLTAMVLEQWPDWVKVAATFQNSA